MRRPDWPWAWLAVVWPLPPGPGRSTQLCDGGKCFASTAPTPSPEPSSAGPSPPAQTSVSTGWPGHRVGGFMKITFLHEMCLLIMAENNISSTLKYLSALLWLHFNAVYGCKLGYCIARESDHLKRILLHVIVLCYCRGCTNHVIFCCAECRFFKCVWSRVCCRYSHMVASCFF